MVIKDIISDHKILELTALYEISRTFASSLNLKVTTNKIMEIFARVLGMRRGTLTLLDPENGELVIEIAHGLSEEEIARGRYKIGEGITGKVMESGEPIIVPDIGKEPLFLNKTKARGNIAEQNISFICVPVKIHGEVIGVLSVDRLFKDGTRSFEEDVRILTVVASLIGQAVKISRMVDEEKKTLIERNIYLQNELKARHRLENVVGRSKRMEEIYDSIVKVSQSKATVLLRGESGTGKELIAKAIHYNSPRYDKPFIKLSCVALPENLLESELFGHEKGSFTGALDMRKGRFELADGGTLFLDEIGDMSPSTQLKLLRVLQERKFERIGGNKTISVDIRLITATNRDLERAVKEGIFREDLYYRLNVVPIFLPPLRERREDIPFLVDHFLKKFNKENRKNIEISHKAIDILMQQEWPGNVRELENLVERIVVMAKGDQIMAKDLSDHLSIDAGSKKPGAGATTTLTGKIEDIEKDQIMAALKKTGWIRARAAKLLGITPRQIGYKIKKYSIKA
ncbi:MAG: nif-specific transcriptional activator NifA [Nitrospirae bacterium]|nr:nif-specific transcriptional activator NifA [Nitrospirota bacterium]